MIAIVYSGEFEAIRKRRNKNLHNANNQSDENNQMRRMLGPKTNFSNPNSQANN